MEKITCTCRIGGRFHELECPLEVGQQITLAERMQQRLAEYEKRLDQLTPWERADYDHIVDVVTRRQRREELFKEATELKLWERILVCTRCGSRIDYGGPVSDDARCSWCPACSPGAPWRRGTVLEESSEARRLRQAEAPH
jgi:hypothetical protein